MRRMRLLLAVLLGFLTAPCAAQLTGVPHVGERAIVVTGERAKGPGTKLSDWRVAETAHVLVFSQGNAKDLARIAQNLEKLHFLLSVLLNRVDAPDDALKMSITMIGDPADFDHLGLRNIRWQQGPYPREFPTQIYYDPREDGAVAATTQTDQYFLLDRGAAVYTADDLEGVMFTGGASSAPIGSPGASGAAPAGSGSGLPGAIAPNTSRRADANNPNVVTVPAEGRLYSTFAQHYLLTYFPAAYPRWYLEGFGQIFSNMDADKDSAIIRSRRCSTAPTSTTSTGFPPSRLTAPGDSRTSSSSPTSGRRRCIIILRQFPGVSPRSRPRRRWET